MDDVNPENTPPVFKRGWRRIASKRCKGESSLRDVSFLPVM
jgi:hypothetical protein